MLIDQPRKLILQGFEFTEDEIRFLKSLFPQMDLAILPKAEIRSSHAIKKALEAGAVLCNDISTNERVTLNLSQDGRELLGKV